MQPDDFTSDGQLRRWYLLDGHARCPFDAVDPAALSEIERDDVLARNHAVRQAIAVVEAYETALVMSVGEQPPETIGGFDPEGALVQRPNPAYTAWLEARATVLGSTAATIALAELRAAADGGGPGPEPSPVDPLHLALRKRQLREEVNARRDALLEGGYAPANGPLAGHVLQTRTVQDRTNWLTSQAAYSAAVAAGQGAVDGARFRSAANETLTLSYAQGLAALLDMALWGAAAMEHSWSIKDLIAAAPTQADLDAIAIDAGWPT